MSPPLPQPRQFQSCFRTLMAKRSQPPHIGQAPTRSIFSAQRDSASIDYALDRDIARPLNNADEILTDLPPI